VITKAYSPLFKKIKPDHPNKPKKLGEQKELDSQFKWYDFMYFFVETLNMKENEVLKSNYINLLNWLAYFKNKKQIENPNQL